MSDVGNVLVESLDFQPVVPNCGLSFGFLDHEFQSAPCRETVKKSETFEMNRAQRQKFLCGSCSGDQPILRPSPHRNPCTVHKAETGVP
jgi:hypothetical protein